MAVATLSIAVVDLIYVTMGGGYGVGVCGGVGGLLVLNQGYSVCGTSSSSVGRMSAIK
jgi:hypothetical protein